MARVTHVVSGAAVVLQTLSAAGGGEQYLYKGAPIVDGVYRQDSLKHAEEIGLIEAVPESAPSEEQAEAARVAAEQKAKADAEAKAEAAAAAAKKAAAPKAPSA